MTVALTMSDVFDQIRVEGNMAMFVNELNLAAAAGKQYIITREIDGTSIALETRSIKIVREVEDNALHSGN